MPPLTTGYHPLPFFLLPSSLLPRPAEHMFFATAERIAAVRRMIAAEELMEGEGNSATDALAALKEFQREDFEGIFTAMDGLPGEQTSNSEFCGLVKSSLTVGLVVGGDVGSRAVRTGLAPAWGWPVPGLWPVRPAGLRRILTARCSPLHLQSLAPPRSDHPPAGPAPARVPAPRGHR